MLWRLRSQRVIIIIIITMTASCAQKVLVSGCMHCDVVNQRQRIRHIEYRSAVALLSLIVQIAVDTSADIRCKISILVLHYLTILAVLESDLLDELS